jgi:hypothetical protein
MRYILITPQGRVYTFYLRGMAETYQKAYGGALVAEHEIEAVELVDTAAE